MSIELSREERNKVYREALEEWDYEMREYGMHPTGLCYLLGVKLRPRFGWLGYREVEDILPEFAAMKPHASKRYGAGYWWSLKQTLNTRRRKLELLIEQTS